MNIEKVSIIVPIYNVERELTRCVNSLLQQEYESFEIILVDDGSQDRSGEIADEFARKFPAFVKVVHQNNRGLSGARNTGIDIATGDYISFVDSDDYVEKNMLKFMVKAMKETEADIAVCGRYDEFPKKRSVNFTLESVKIFTNEEALRCILTWNGLDIAAWDKLYKRKLWENIRFPMGKNNEDICTLPSVLKAAKKIVHVALPLYHYCHRENSITTTYNEKKIKDFFDAIQHLDKYVTNEYPEIMDERVFYTNHLYLSLIKMCEQIRYNGAEKQIAIGYLYENWKNKFSFNRMSKIDKISYFLIKYNLYYLVKRIMMKSKELL